MTQAREKARKLCARATRLKQEGDFGKAAALYRQALAADPTDAVVYYERMDLPGLEVSDRELGQMQSMADGARPPERMLFAFALARHYDRVGDYETAFQYLREANRLKRAQLDYDPQVIRRDVAMLTEAFTEEAFRERPADPAARPGHKSRRPIFIIGMPRSGTTLVEQVLAAHPQVVAGGELAALERAVQPLYPLVQMARPRHERLAAIDERQRIQAAANYLRQLPEAGGSKRRVTDKMPFNFLHVGWIFLLFANPRVVLVKRDRMATLFSCYQNHFANGNEFSYDLAELDGYYQSFELLTAYWQALFPGEIMELHYEALVTGMEAEVRRLLDYCELPWHEACLEPHKNRGRVTTLSTAQVRQPVYPDALDHWRHYAHLLEQAGLRP